MSETAQRLKRFASPAPSHWRENAAARLANQDTRRKAREVAMSMLNAMETRGIDQSALSDLLGITTAELLPILKGHQLPSPCLSQEIETALEINL